MNRKAAWWGEDTRRFAAAVRGSDDTPLLLAPLPCPHCLTRPWGDCSTQPCTERAAYLAGMFAAQAVRLRGPA